MIWGSAVLWGVGDAALNTQLSAALAVLDPQRTVQYGTLWVLGICWSCCRAMTGWSQETAFAAWKVCQSLASALSFFVGARVGTTLRVLTLLVVLLACFLLLWGKDPSNKPLPYVEGDWTPEDATCRSPRGRSRLNEYSVVHE